MLWKLAHSVIADTVFDYNHDELKGNNMKRIILIAFVSLGFVGYASGAITRKQAEKLVAAAWELPPSSMDITYCVAFEDNTRTEQDVRKIYEGAYSRLNGPKEELLPGLKKSREVRIQKNVDRFLKEQREGGRKSTYRIRFNENCVRVDQAYSSFCPQTSTKTGNTQNVVQPDKTADSDIQFDFSSIEVVARNGTVERFEYSHQGNRIC
jgi:hypothetical protein